MTDYVLRPIGVIHSPYREMEGTPIQPVYGEEARGHVVVDAELLQSRLNLPHTTDLVAALGDPPLAARAEQLVAEQAMRSDAQERARRQRWLQNQLRSEQTFPQSILARFFGNPKCKRKARKKHSEIRTEKRKYEILLV